jgi:transcriptional regulator of NAD metabolism
MNLMIKKWKEVNKILNCIKLDKNKEKTDPVLYIKREMEILIQDIGALLDERDKILSNVTNVDVAKKYKNSNAIETKLNTLQSELGKFKQELSSMKKNKSKNKGNHNIERLDDMLNNFGEQYGHLKVI